MRATGERRAELEDEVELLRTDAAAPVAASPGFEQLMSRKRRTGLSYFTARELEQQEDDGSRTRSQLLAVIGARWRALPAAEQAAFQAAAAKEDAQGRTCVWDSAVHFRTVQHGLARFRPAAPRSEPL